MNVRDDLSKQGAQRRLNLFGDRNQCPTCGELFNSSGAFEKHRTGDFTARHCLTVNEMHALGMARNDRGFWVKAPMTDEERARARQHTTTDATGSIATHA